MLYAIIVLALIYLVWRFFTNKKIYRHELEMEKLKEKNMQELSRARIKFFTNISHDLKTPLTLIVDPLRKLKERLPEDSPAMAAIFASFSALIASCFSELEK